MARIFKKKKLEACKNRFVGRLKYWDSRPPGVFEYLQYKINNLPREDAIPCIKWKIAKAEEVFWWKVPAIKEKH